MADLGFLLVGAKLKKVEELMYFFIPKLEEVECFLNYKHENGSMFFT